MKILTNSHLFKIGQLQFQRFILENGRNFFQLNQNLFLIKSILGFLIYVYSFKLFTIDQLKIKRYRMPFLVSVEIRESIIQGNGVFALQDIPKGTVCWAFQAQKPIPAVGVVTYPNNFLTKEELQQLSQEERARVLHFGTYDAFSDRMLNLRDGSGFTNHSDDASCRVIYSEDKIYKDTKTIAIRYILKGDELTENYNKYPFEWPSWLYEMVEKDIPERAKFNDVLLQKEKQNK